VKESNCDVSVIGLGYIGLPTAAMFASGGCSVVGVDISPRIVDSVNTGTAHFEEAGLSELVDRCVLEGRLRASPMPVQADNFIIAVPTPVDHETHRPDIGYVLAAARSIAPVLKAGDLIVLESTSPVGTTREVADLLATLRPDLAFPSESQQNPSVHLAYCPERIIPGHMIRELVENDRIIGGMTPACAARASALYGRFVKGNCISADDRTAELCKLTENAFRDVNIAFANELSMICGSLGLDVWKVIELANHHPRVNILNPGPGVGGHCIAVDPWFIVAGAPDVSALIRTARQVNDAKPHYIVSLVQAALKENPDATIGCFGLTYKADVDDFRESPALDIAVMLSKAYAGRVVCTDPFMDALENSGADTKSLTLVGVEEALAADLVVLLVGHSDYRKLAVERKKQVIDTIGLWR
jgi:UDP-N-acetyl-D-mannosaminuronic acid dehydrogenase